MNISTVELLDWLVKASYLAAATLFLLGLQRMASPVTARSGIRWAGLGMVIATAATFLLPGLHNLGLIVLALGIGTLLAWVSGKKVAAIAVPVRGERNTVVACVNVVAITRATKPQQLAARYLEPLRAAAKRIEKALQL